MNLEADSYWKKRPLRSLSHKQKIQFKNQADTCCYTIGNEIWHTDSPGNQFLIIKGKVRLKEEGKEKSLAILKEGNWFGDLIELSGQFKAVASSKDVEVLRWDAALWARVSSPGIKQFWNQKRSRYQPPEANAPQPVSGYPFVSSLNTAGACLTMAAQYLKIPIQLESVQRLWNQKRSRYQSGNANSPQRVSGYPFVFSLNTAATCLTMAAQYLKIPIQLESVQRLWNQKRSRYQPPEANAPQPVSGYPFISSSNTAAACLTMAAQYLQIPIQLESVQRQMGGDPNDFIGAGEKIGLQLRQLQIDSWNDLRQLSFPILLHWNEVRGEEDDKETWGQGRLGNNSLLAPHWIVVYVLKGNRLIIADPTNVSQTCQSIPQTMLEENWDGQLWQVEQIQKQEKFNLSWFVPAIWKHRRLLGEVFLLSFTLQLLGLATPIVTQFIIDRALVYENINTLNVMAIALLGVMILEAILGILRLFIFSHTANRLDLSLSAQLFRQLMRLPLSYFESRRVGDTVARAQELENIRQFLTGTALTVILDSIFSILYLALMFFYSVTLTWVALAVIPLFAALTLIATPILRNYLNETFNRGADSQSFLVETVTGIHAVKAHAAERKSRRRWEGLFARYIRTSFKASTTSNISSNIGDFLTNFSYLIILWVGAKLVMDRRLTIGGLVAFQMLSSRVTDPLLRLVQLWQEFQQVLLSVDRLGDILNIAPEAEPGSGVVLPPLRGKVDFKQVFFRYQPEQKEPVLKGISFSVEPGMFVGIVGSSGSGKSTLSKLLQRLYEPELGSILIDDCDIKTADIGSLRRQISVVLQDDFLFDGSISENITLGDPEIKTDQVIRAAKLAAADDFIIKMPRGYETIIGERGVALSGGQRQRIALARLFLSQEARIWILDEATSGLDSETEQKVLQSLEEEKGDRTVFMIAHRFAPLKRADLILVLEKGVIAEQGTHEELFKEDKEDKKKGIYQALYKRQLDTV